MKERHLRKEHLRKGHLRKGRLRKGHLRKGHLRKGHSRKGHSRKGHSRKSGCMQELFRKYTTEWHCEKTIKQLACDVRQDELLSVLDELCGRS